MSLCHVLVKLNIQTTTRLLGNRSQTQHVYRGCISVQVVLSTNVYPKSRLPTGTKWSSRRLRQLTLRSMTSLAAHRACALSRALGLMSRVRASAAAVLPSEGAAGQGRLLAQAVNVTCFNDAQVYCLYLSQ